MKIKLHSPKSVKQGRPTKGTEGNPSDRFLLCLGDSQRTNLTKIDSWNRQYLKVKCTLSFLIRTAIDEFTSRELAKQQKVKQGRFHAKTRKDYTA